MSNYNRCPDCKQWVWGPCTCRVFLVAVEGWDENGQGGLEFTPQSAEDAEAAAVAHVEERDCEDSDYHVARGDEVTVVVKRGDEISKHLICGEFVPEYWARKS